MLNGGRGERGKGKGGREGVGNGVRNERGRRWRPVVKAVVVIAIEVVVKV
jgi:hypothetical protein